MDSDSRRGFTGLESAVIRKALAGDHPVLETLRTQFADAKVVARQLTGVGFFVDIATKPQTPTTSQRTLDISDVWAQVPGLERGAGFVLHVRDGRMNLLEGYSYDEPWAAENVSGFRLEYGMGDERSDTVRQLNRTPDLDL